MGACGARLGRGRSEMAGGLAERGRPADAGRAAVTRALQRPAAPPTNVPVPAPTLPPQSPAPRAPPGGLGWLLAHASTVRARPLRVVVSTE